MRRLTIGEPGEDDEPAQETGFHGIDSERDRALKERLKNGEQISLSEALGIITSPAKVDD